MRSPKAIIQTGSVLTLGFLLTACSTQTHKQSARYGDSGHHAASSYEQSGAYQYTETHNQISQGQFSQGQFAQSQFAQGPSNVVALKSSRYGYEVDLGCSQPCGPVMIPPPPVVLRPEIPWSEPPTPQPEPPIYVPPTPEPPVYEPPVYVPPAPEPPVYYPVPDPHPPVWLPHKK